MTRSGSPMMAREGGKGERVGESVDACVYVCLCVCLR